MDRLMEDTDTVTLEKLEVISQQNRAIVGKGGDNG